MKIKSHHPQNLVPRILAEGEHHAAYVGLTFIGNYRTEKLAEAAVSGVLAFISGVQPKSNRLATGIYMNGSRFVVRSPYYLGSFPTLEEALAAQAHARANPRPKPMIPARPKPDPLAGVQDSATDAATDAAPPRPSTAPPSP